MVLPQTEMIPISTMQSLKSYIKISNVGETASLGMITFFESRHSINNQPVKVLVSSHEESLTKHSQFFTETIGAKNCCL